MNTFLVKPEWVKTQSRFVEIISDPSSGWFENVFVSDGIQIVRFIITTNKYDMFFGDGYFVTHFDLYEFNGGPQTQIYCGVLCRNLYSNNKIWRLGQPESFKFNGRLIHADDFLNKLPHWKCAVNAMKGPNPTTLPHIIGVAEMYENASTIC